MRHLYATVVVMALGSCAPALDINALEDDCRNYCGNVLMCPYNRVPGETEEQLFDRITSCSDGCLVNGEESLSQTRECAAAYGTIIACLADLSCEDLSLRGVSDEFLCAADETEMRSACMGIWGNGEMQK